MENLLIKILLNLKLDMFLKITLLNDTIKNIALGIPEKAIDLNKANRALELSNLINDFKISKSN